MTLARKARRITEPRLVHPARPERPPSCAPKADRLILPKLSLATDTHWLQPDFSGRVIGTYHRLTDIEQKQRLRNGAALKVLGLVALLVVVPLVVVQQTRPVGTLDGPWFAALSAQWLNFIN